WPLLQFPCGTGSTRDELLAGSSGRWRAGAGNTSDIQVAAYVFPRGRGRAARNDEAVAPLPQLPRRIIRSTRRTASAKTSDCDILYATSTSFRPSRLYTSAAL